MNHVDIALSISDDGDEKKTCIDGKQRLTSIQKYVAYIRLGILALTRFGLKIHGWACECYSVHINVDYN